MNREQVEQIARKHFGDALPHYIADWVVPAIMDAVAIERADEREACARVCDEFVAATWDGQADADTLAKDIRARGER